MTDEYDEQDYWNRPWELDNRCPKCGGIVGHRINCPDGIAFSDKEEMQKVKEQTEEYDDD